MRIGRNARLPTSQARQSGAIAAIAAVAIVGLGTMGSAVSQAEVCTGGYPSPAAGNAPASLLGAVPILTQLRYAAEKLPQWETTAATREWGTATATAWYGNVTLWDTQGGASWWVLPTTSCDNMSTNQDCVLVAAELKQVSSYCLNPDEIAAGSQPRSVALAGQWLISGFAPAGSGSVTVSFANGTRVLPAYGGVYGGRAPATLGAVTGATFGPAYVPRPMAAVAIVDETGLFTSSRGPLASTGRLRAMAATLRARLGVTPTILGTAIATHRSHTTVLYGAGARDSAIRAARALHVPAPLPLLGGPLTMFGSVARVVVLAGLDHKR
ncbi:MAG: hypothetical protein QOH12_1689 [Solirubrobacteraceae bacterium]|jgi:hypothetical protein|nr:hypothetical protein [Solirubrobacteraceae bacterium]